MLKKLLSYITALSIVFYVAIPVCEGQEVKNVSVLTYDVGTENVTLSDERLLNAQDLDIAFLLELEPQKFLYSFYITCGVTLPDGVTDYKDTWEQYNDAIYPGNNFRGHMFGHYMSALSMAYRMLEENDVRREQLFSKLNECITGLKDCQDKYGQTYPGRFGFVAPFTEGYLNALDGQSGGAGKVSGDNVYVPWYNLHKVLAGLIDVYKNLSNNEIGEMSLDIAKAFGDYFYTCRASQYNQTQRDNMLKIEYGGMNEAFYELYRLTGDTKYKTNAECFDEVSFFKELADGKDVLAGKHANTQIPKFIGALKRYTTLTQNQQYYNGLTQSEKDSLSMYLKAAENFFDVVLEGHTYITGGNSTTEKFYAANTLASRINERDTHETCNEHNMLKLARELYKLTGDKKYSDYYENTFINSILSSQNPETGEMMYFQPMGAGFNKVFGKDRFWCCTGTGIENFTKLGDSIYFKSETSVYVNMYFSSSYKFEERNLLLTQTADMPKNSEATISVSAIDGNSVTPGTSLYLRIPDWCVGQPGIMLNDTATQLETDGGYIIVPNVSTGDNITLTFPMEVSLDALVDNPNYVAFKYGPVVLSTGLGNRDMELTQSHGIMVYTAVRDTTAPSVISIQNGVTVEEWKENITENLVREDDENGNALFKLKGTSMDERLIYSPHYERYDDRYGLYMFLSEPDTPELQAQILTEKQRLQREATVSAELTTFDANNYEAFYNVQSQGSSVGTYSGRTYRDADKDSGWFSYEFPIAKDVKNYLNTTYTTADNGRSFDIYINGEFLATETITNSGVPTGFYTVTREINTEYLDDDKITVKFQSNGSTMVGGLYGISITQPADTDPHLVDLTFDKGILAPEFNPSITEYTLTLESDTDTMAMRVTPRTESALIYSGNILIDDTQERIIKPPFLPDTIVLNCYAQDHTTSIQYKINVQMDGIDTSKKLMARYDFEQETIDSVNSAFFVGKSHLFYDTIKGSRVLYLDGAEKPTYMQFNPPYDINKNVLEEYTVSFDVKNMTTGNYFNFYIGDGTVGGTGNNYLGVKVADKVLVSTRDTTSEYKAEFNTVAQGLWKHFDVTVSNGTSKVYVDGEFIGEVAGHTMEKVKAAVIRFGFSPWSNDVATTAYYDNIEIYSYEKGATEILESRPERPVADPSNPKLLFAIDFNEGNAETIKGKATPNGGISYATGAAVMNGSDTYISASNEDGSPLLKGKDKVVIAMRAFPETKSGNAWLFFAAPNTNTPNSNSRRYAGMYYNTTSKYITVERFLNNSGTPTIVTDLLTERWRDFVLVIDDNVTELYLDGLFIGSASYSNALLSQIMGDDDSQILHFGRSTWSSGEQMKGKLDDIEVYDFVPDIGLDGLDLNNVNKSISLRNPTMEEDGYTIDWVCSEPELIVGNKLVCPINEEKEVTLTAKINFGSYTIIKENTVKMFEKDSISISNLQLQGETISYDVNLHSSFEIGDNCVLYVAAFKESKGAYLFMDSNVNETAGNLNVDADGKYIVKFFIWSVQNNLNPLLESYYSVPHLIADHAPDFL